MNQALVLSIVIAVGCAACGTTDAELAAPPDAGDGNGIHPDPVDAGASVEDADGGSDAGASLQDAGEDPVPDAGVGVSCGQYSNYSHFNCSGDGMSRLKCVNGYLVTESCERGCLIRPLGQDDECMGTSSTWSCGGTTGTTKMEDGDYYATAFGCWTDANGNQHSDPGDNCIPACLSQAQHDGLCAGLSGPDCEMAVNWFAADSSRFGCLARLRVSNPENGKSAVVVVLDAGPACWVERSVSGAILDLSGRVNRYLFGADQGASDRARIHVVEVDRSTPLGPVN